jgi:LPPG:FO 2-phospho-L-lactate transferase
VKIVVLSGGTGTPKLLIGFKKVVEETSLGIIVNTAEDVWVSGNKVCPDIDSVIYALSGEIDTKKWWGIRDDSFLTNTWLKSLGYEEPLMIGDKDRATHILRSEMLRKGLSLTETTKILAKTYGVTASILPMTEHEVATMISTPEGVMHFQEFWVGRKGEPEVIDVFIRGIEGAEPTEEVIRAIETCDAVVIGPSNPVTSIGPILSLKGVKELLKEKLVVAVSPFLGDKPFSGPAGKFMTAKGFEPSSRGILEYYKDIINWLVLDHSDTLLKGITVSDNYRKIRVVKTNTVMKSRENSIRLAEFIVNLFDEDV